MNVIPFQAKPYILIISQMAIEERVGTACVRHDPPLRLFWLELVETDRRTVVWDGTTYLDALMAANEWAVDNVKVRDRVAPMWRRL